MTDELRDSLRHIQTHPTSGEAHNAQLINIQVEEIFAIDGLNREIKKLKKTIEKSDIQSARLEQSNYNLQRVMLILTSITTIIAVYPVMVFIYSNMLTPIFSNLALFNPVIFASVLSVLIGVLTAFVASYSLNKDKIDFYQLIGYSESNSSTWQIKK